MRYSIRVSSSFVLGIFMSTGCNKSDEAELNKARGEVQQLKADLDKMGAEREVLMKTSLKPKPEDYPRPALESVPEMDGQAKFLGFDSINVYRWRGGTLEGSVQFDTEAGPVKHELQVTKIAKQVFAYSKDLPYDPRAVSGVVMIAIKKSTKDQSKKIYDCVVNIQVVVVPKSINAGQIPPVPGQVIWGPMSGKAGSTISGEIDGSTLGDLTWFSNVATGSAVTGSIGGDPRTKKTFQIYELKVSTDVGK